MNQNAAVSHRIVLGVTGGIAAYKSAELARLLVKDGFEVEAVLTEAATHFVGAATFRALTGRPVLTGLWSGSSDGMNHIHASRGAAAIVVAPASADFLAKLAHGLADDLLSALCLARSCPLLVAPAMNREMWANPATQRNVAALRGDGVSVVGPTAGDQACGESGPGRMAEAAEIAEAVGALSAAKTLAGVRVLVTAGPTFEAVDAVRAITNRSSGRMGYAVARAALEAGADVTLVTGPTCLAAPSAARVVAVTTAAEMLAAVEANVDDCDVFVSVAAVADYYVLNPSESKIKKDAHILTLELAPNPDILANVASRENAPFCVGFAAESENLNEYAEMKRRAKRLPLLAGNLVPDALSGEESRLTLFDDDGIHPLPRAPKRELARALIVRIGELYPAWVEAGRPGG